MRCEVEATATPKLCRAWRTGTTVEKHPMNTKKPDEGCVPPFFRGLFIAPQRHLRMPPEGGVHSIVFEIVEKPPKRMAPDSQFIRGIVVACGQATLGFALTIR